MIRKQFLFLLFVFLLQNGFGQIVFNKTNDLNSIYQNKIIATKDGGYLVAGSKYESQLFAAKLNSFGDTIWKSMPDYGEFFSAIETSDGNFVLAGYQGQMGSFDGMEGNAVVLFTKLDKQTGNVIWSKTMNQFGIPYSSFRDLIETKDKGLILCGNSTEIDMIAEEIVSKVLIVKTNNLGELEWYKTNGKGIYKSITVLENKQLILTRFDSNISKTDSLGNEIWTKYFNISNPNFIILSDGNYALAGSKKISNDSTAPCLTKVSPEGDTLWQKIFKEKYKLVFFNDLIQLTNGNIVACARSMDYSLNNTKNISYLKSINSFDGSLDWSKEYLFELTDTTRSNFKSMDICPDGGMIIAGEYTFAKNNIWKGGSWLVKTDCQGNDTFWDYAACSENIEDELTIFPNPTSTIFTAVTIEENIAEIFLYNTLGELVFSEKPNKKFASINVENQSDGIYNCVVTTESNKQISRKVVVLR